MSDKDFEQRVRKAYAPETFRQQAHALTDMLADYLEQAESKRLDHVLAPNEPNALYQAWQKKPLPAQGAGEDALLPFLREVLQESIHVHHPHYLGHQVSAPLPVAALCDLMSSLLNNGAAVYEMGPMENIFGRLLVEWMGKTLGMGDKTGGVMTSGGSMGNLTALLAARQVKAGVDVWNEGNSNKNPLAIMVSDQSHYCIERAARLMGLGADGVIKIRTDAAFQIQPEAIEVAYAEAQRRGRKVFAIVGGACSTATGTFENLEALAAFAKAHDLWFHVDAAHGAPTILSELHRHKLKGVEHADSVIWDAHKMMMMPALITAVVFRNHLDSYAPFSQAASYLFHGNPQDEWYHSGIRTLECTKVMMSLKLYICIQLYGTAFFGEFVEHQYAQTARFADMLKAAPDFEIAVEPQANIICFRYRPEGTRDADMDDLQAHIRSRILETGKFYIVRTTLPTGIHLRCTLLNPLLHDADLSELMVLIRELGTEKLQKVA